MTYGKIVKQSNDFVDGTAHDQHQASKLKRWVLGLTKSKKGEEFDIFSVSPKTTVQFGLVAFPIKYPSDTTTDSKTLSWKGYVPTKYDASSHTLTVSCPASGKFAYSVNDKLPCSIFIVNFNSTEIPRVQIVDKHKVEYDSPDPITIPIGDGAELVVYFGRSEVRKDDIYFGTHGQYKHNSHNTVYNAAPQVVVRGIPHIKNKNLKLHSEIIP